MGYPPDLPEETSGQMDFNPTNEHIVNVGQNTSEDSDNENNDNPYEGYQPIPFGENGDDNMMVDDDDDENDEDTETNIPPDNNIPNVISVDAEIEQEIWSKPRPKELEIELDSSKQEQIMAAMATITLPTSAIPPWAQGISDDKWKENLLERIRQRKEVLSGSNPN